MHNIIDNNIEWNRIGTGRKKHFCYSIENAAIKKESKELNILLRLNFVIPYDNLELIRKALLKELPQVSGVSFNFLYYDMAMTEEEIIEHCKNHLASFKKPKSVDFVSDLPKNPYGKVLRRKLRERYWEGQDRMVH